MSYDIKNIKVRPIHADILITDMEFGDMQTKSGIVIQSDDAKSHGIKPRWGKVYKVGPEQTDIKVGQWILVEHGRWTRQMKIDDGDGVKNIQKVDLKCILAVADKKPEDIYIGEEVDLSPPSIRPEEFQR